ncbi:MAG: hypothetical protein E7662_08420 [Ruminococcaceae bacterium]|nr:hypothetical protein [Oscillospiraceae bacterium]
MKFSVGLGRPDPAFLECIGANRDRIYEVYFSWGDFPNGRSSQLMDGELPPWEMQKRQTDALETLSGWKIPLNILFNANCYGAESQSRSFFNKIGTTVDYMQSHYTLASVTTTSPLIAKFIKANFEGLEVRASVNMEIGTVEGMDYLAEYFDGYYMKRELNRDFDTIRILHGWAQKNGKKLYMLANSGCLNFCSAHNFHDNLVAHEAEIAARDNAYQFSGMCRDYLKKEANILRLPEITNFVRPEDMHLYDTFFVAAKLATRVHRAPAMVLNAYLRGKYSGDLLALLEPQHSVYPYVLENGETGMRVRRIE